MTICELKDSCEGLTVGCCGDLFNGRTVHSLLRAMSRFPGNRFVLISTPELKLPSYVTDELKAAGCEFCEVETLEECISELDILYMTRIQRERFKTLEDYNRQAGVYRLTADKWRSRSRIWRCCTRCLRSTKSHTTSTTTRARSISSRRKTVCSSAWRSYLSCAEPSATGRPPVYGAPEAGYCKNPRCISNHEKYLPKRVKVVGGEDAVSTATAR